MSLSFSLSIIVNYLCAMLAMAFYTLLERKLLGYFQLRKGPNKVGIMGLPQPFADALKLFLKEQNTPTHANISPYIFAPIFSLILALLLWSLFPHPFATFFMPLGLLFFIATSSLNVYATLSAGWASNSKFALLGAMRGVAQTISYEVSMIFILLPIPIIMSSYDLMHMKSMQSTPIMFMCPPLVIMWFISILAETNRTPFDFAEGESELVSGFNVEYSGASFALIFMAEYANILVMSLLTAIFFAGTMTPFFTFITIILITLMFSFIFIWARATFPRMRYDRLMSLTWKSFLPLAIILLLIFIPLLSIMM